MKMHLCKSYTKSSALTALLLLLFLLSGVENSGTNESTDKLNLGSSSSSNLLGKQSEQNSSKIHSAELTKSTSAEVVITKAAITEEPITEATITEEPITKTAITEEPITKTAITQVAETEGKNSSVSQTEIFNSLSVKSKSKIDQDGSTPTPSDEQPILDATNVTQTSIHKQNNSEMLFDENNFSGSMKGLNHTVTFDEGQSSSNEFESDILEALNLTDVVPGIEMRRMLRKCSNISVNSSNNGSHPLPTEPINCNGKIELSLRLANKGKSHGHTEYILVNSVHDILTGQVVYLDTPLVIQLKQEPVVVAYALNYLQSVNSKPYELVLNKDNVEKYTGCLNAKSAKMQCVSLAEGPTYSAGSTGFCCGCSDDLIPGNSTIRRSTSCGDDNENKNHQELHTSTHCLRFSPLWYAVHSLESPHLHHGIQVKIYRQSVTGHDDKDISWHQITDTDLVLSTDKHWTGTHNDQVVGRYWSQMELDREMELDYKRHNILIPEPIYSRNHLLPDELKQGPHSYLFLNSSDISDGTHCDMIGVSYSAFLGQINKCQKPVQSCLDNQPRDLYLEDQAHRMEFDGNSSHLLGERVSLSSPAIVHNHVTGEDKLHVMYEDPFVSVVDLQINADDMNFIHPGDHLEILQVTSVPSPPNNTIGFLELSVLVMNTGRITANVTVQLVRCHPLMLHGLSQELILDPEHSGQTVFLIEGHESQHERVINNTCVVEVVNSVYEPVAVMEVWFVLGQRCYCIIHCMCQCGMLNGMRCRGVSDMDKHQTVLSDATNDWDIVIATSFFNIQSVSQISMISGAAFFIFGLVKAFVSLKSSSKGGMFGFTMCFPANRGVPPSRVKLFCLNLFFLFLAPFLFIFWISQLVALIIQKPLPQHEYQPLLPKPMCLETMKPLISITSPVDPVPAINTTMDGTVAADTIDQFKQHKQQAKINSQVEALHDTEVVSENIPAEPGQHSQETPDFSDFLEPEKVVFCNYNEVHPGLVNSGAHFSLCGQLTVVTADLFKFSIELNQTQVYENVGDRVTSLTNLYPLKEAVFTRILSRDDVMECISHKPRHPCLNKVL